MKRNANTPDLTEAIRDLAHAMKPSARHLTEGQVEQIIKDARREARKDKSDGRSTRRR